MSTDTSETVSPSRLPRAVPAAHALAWFGEALRLWKCGPATFGAIAVVVLLASIALEPVPIAGLIAANVVAPLLACGLLYGCLGADRDGKPRFLHLAAVFGAPLSAQWAVVAAGFVVLAAEAFVAWQIAGVNLLLPLSDAASLPASGIMVIYAIGILVSLPVTFVPMAALFDGESPSRAFGLSLRAFALNVPALLLLAAYSFVLLMLGLATMGVGLVLALPWIAAASYAAWKDIFGLQNA